MPASAAAFACLLGWAQGQVSVTVGGAPIIGPGAKTATIKVCNETNSPQQVQGWKFKTRDFADYTTWMQVLTKSGTAPVEYNQTINSTEQQMKTGFCRQVTDYNGSPAAGQDATPIDPQALIKTGSCNEVPPYKDAAPITCGEIDALRGASAYYGNQCLVDSIGSNGGDTYGGFVSTFYGQTQIQAAIPAGPFNISATPVKWNPYAMGPQYMMALGMAQEIMNVDMQFLASISGKETGAGMVDQNSGKVRSEDGSYVDNGTYSYWQIEQDTYATTIKAYPQFFPKYGNCISRYPDVTSASTDCAGGSWGTAAEFYMQPTGQNKMGPNNPQISNGAISSALIWYALYDALVQSTDLCFIDAIVNGIDKRIAFAAMIGGYNQGRYTDFAGPLKDPNLKNNPNASSLFSPGNFNYRVEVFSIMDALVNASKASTACGGAARLYDTAITLNDVQRFLFGGSIAAGTSSAQGDGGLLLHYPLGASEKQALWTEVQCAFDKLKGKAPSTAGKDAISYRYDWLTLLRVVKRHLPFHIKDRKPPVENDFQHVVNTYSKNPRSCSGKLRDEDYPSMTITAPDPNGIPALPPVVAPGFKVAFQASDAVGPVLKGEWSMDRNWGTWKPAVALGSGKFEFAVACELPGYPKKGEKGSLWVRTTDGCGNSTVQLFAWTSSGNCGDPPQVAMPEANPKSQDFSSLSAGLSVTLTTATAGATILYTIDGSVPDTVAGGSTRQYTGAILITQTTVLQARGVMAGLFPSDVMKETYSRVDPGKVATPMADPRSRNYVGPSLQVVLSITTPGAAILYTVDGSDPDTVARGATRLYVAGVPLSITGDAAVKAIGVKAGMFKSDVMVEKYTNLPPIAIRKAWYLDGNGDGLIEKARVEFAARPPRPPEKLTFTIVAEDGQSHARTVFANKGEIAAGPDSSSLAVSFSQPFPFGVTSLKNRDNSGQAYRQDDIPLSDGFFAVDDSAAPVIVKAETKEPGGGQPLKRVLITYSEPVRISPSAVQALAYKRDGAEVPAADVRHDRVEKTGEAQYAFHVDSSSDIFPIVGDSAAIATAGQTLDAHGNGPAFKLFRVLEGIRPQPKPVSLIITAPDGSTKRPSQGIHMDRKDHFFVPVDAGGNPLTGSADGKCGDCAVSRNGIFVGPVIHLITPGPVAYDFKIFSHLGEFVTQGSGRIVAQDLPLLKRQNDSTGIRYDAPIVWTGGAASLRAAGTGAYILRAVLTTGRDSQTGAGPGRQVEQRIFGLIRN